MKYNESPGLKFRCKAQIFPLITNLINSTSRIELNQFYCLNISLLTTKIVYLSTPMELEFLSKARVLPLNANGMFLGSYAYSLLKTISGMWFFKTFYLFFFFANLSDWRGKGIFFNDGVNGC